MRLRVLTLPLLASLAGCVYYNGMWAADQFAGQARHAEADGQDLTAQADWAQAAVKAESVAARHPRSRWAQPALTLAGEGLGKTGSCDRAAELLARVLAVTTDSSLRERADLTLADCALQIGHPADAITAAEGVMRSRDATRRSRAAEIVGRARVATGDLDGGVAAFAASDQPDAAPERARALLALGQVGPALAVADSLRARRVDERQWTALVGDIASLVGEDSAAALIDRLQLHSHVPPGALARLLLADGDRRFAAGQAALAAERYTAVTVLVPDSVEAGRARVRGVKSRAAQTRTPGEALPLEVEIEHLQSASLVGDASPEANALKKLLLAVGSEQQSAEERFRTAEVVRDSLGATALAGALFLEVAAAYPTSLFAPKALIAALPLLPDSRDSLVAALDAGYSTSPYTLALRGQESPAFGALEDSLGAVLGVTLRPPTSFVGSPVAPPVPGPRGPSLEGEAPAPATAPRARPRPPARVRPQDRP